MIITLDIPEAEFNRYRQYYKPYIIAEICPACKGTGMGHASIAAAFDDCPVCNKEHTCRNCSDQKSGCKGEDKDCCATNGYADWRGPLEN